MALCFPNFVYLLYSLSFYVNLFLFGFSNLPSFPPDMDFELSVLKTCVIKMPTLYIARENANMHLVNGE